MLVAFPVAFYTSSFVAFIIYAAKPNVFFWQLGTIATWAGVITALVAALPGFIDWLVGIPRGTAAKTTGLMHMLLNVLALATFLVNGLMQAAQWNEPIPEVTAAVVLSAIGLAFTLPAGFLGWKMVQRHHVGVDLTPEQERLEPVSGRAPPQVPAEPFRPISAQR
jgi:uncharacterized membrane protein